MSVRSETYLLYGWLLDYKDFEQLPESQQEAIYDLPGGWLPQVGEVARLIDGMGGKYVAVGIVMGVATYEDGGFSPMVLSEVHMPANIGEAKTAAQAFSPDLGEPALVLLTHYH